MEDTMLTYTYVDNGKFELAKKPSPKILGEGDNSQGNSCFNLF